jgi:hypothetical protein
MEYTLKRPAGRIDPGTGLLLAEHFQVAYVTNDIKRACKIFASHLGIGSFSKLEGPLKAGGHIEAKFAWVGSVMYEIIQASGPGSELYGAKPTSMGRFDGQCGAPGMVDSASQ